MQLPESYSFHEASVDKFFRPDDCVRLELSGIYGDDDDDRYAAVLEVSGVRLIETDAVGSNLMAAEDGEVLTLEHGQNELYVIIEWRNYSPNKTFIHAYRVHGENVTVTVL